MKPLICCSFETMPYLLNSQSASMHVSTTGQYTVRMAMATMMYCMISAVITDIHYG